MDEANIKYMQIRQEIISLKARLSANTSDIGDYRIVKVYEARLKGDPDPYDVDTLLAERQEVRDKIAELEKELEALDESTEDTSND